MHPPHYHVPQLLYTESFFNILALEMYLLLLRFLLIIYKWFCHVGFHINRSIEALCTWIYIFHTCCTYVNILNHINYISPTSASIFPMPTYPPYLLPIRPTNISLSLIHADFPNILHVFLSHVHISTQNYLYFYTDPYFRTFHNLFSLMHSTLFPATFSYPQA